jgi:Helicase conserved C-terminal domain/SNF2-related domain
VSWQLSLNVSLRNDRIGDADADRQQRTAAEILDRLAEQPGVVLADEVGMGKTYVALAVAVSVVQATRYKRPVVVMVPTAVAEKWPTEWAVFAERSLSPGHRLRASAPVRRGSEFLKLLDDPATTRQHLIFITHGALTSNLNDPFIRLALLRQALQRRPDLATRRRAVARFADALLNDKRFDEDTVAALLETPVGRWQDVWNRRRPHNPLPDDPVPSALQRPLKQVDLGPLREALAAVPVHRNVSFRARMRAARRQLNHALNATWTQNLGALDVHLPLLILDEAHHLKNPTRLARLFANGEAEQDAEALQGPLGNMFDRMLFLTATPFQLGHHELLNVLDRFHGVRWPSAAARTRFDDQTEQLRAALDRAQGTALRLERAWSRIDPADSRTVAALRSFEPDSDQPEAVRTALAIAAEARTEITAAEELLQPWVIRHLKPHKADRRRYRPGRAILDGGDSDIGLPVGGPATLPFLLAARAQAIASLHGTHGEQATRAYFAYGLASSFEAYADTRRNRVAEIDEQDDTGMAAAELSPQLRWYLDRIAAALPADTTEGWATHPKIAATVNRVRDPWCNGEKTLVFCFYVETGRALRAHISRVLRREIISRAATGLAIDPDDEEEVLAALDRVGERLLRADSRGYDAFRQRIQSLAADLDEATQDHVADIVTRFMRTPSFLARFVDLSPNTSVDDLITGLDRPDLSGTTMASRVRGFTTTLGQKVNLERAELLTALAGIQTGGIATTADFDPSERTRHREVLLPNVRLANGGVRQDTRRRLMLAFNTPFFPEVLVASSVMAEGVDLHQDCRHVIHHDLDWNPSTLEQRTGRVDRIGSKAETTHQPVIIYEPYLAGTHDEKMFRVVKDRERWFSVVMGETRDSGERATEQQATQVPLPIPLAEQLTMDLSLHQRPTA